MLLFLLMGCTPPVLKMSDDVVSIMHFPGPSVSIIQVGCYDSKDSTKLIKKSSDPCSEYPKLLTESYSDYPEIAVKKNIHGKILLRVNVGENGIVTGAKVLETSSDLFVKSALDKIFKLVFVPYKVDCRPQKFTAIVGYLYEL